MRRPGSAVKRPERGLGRARPLLVSYLGLKAWRRDADPAISGVQAPVANSGNDSPNEPRQDRGSLLLPDVVVRCDVHVSPSARQNLCAVATGETPISDFRDVAVVVKFRVVGYAESHSPSDYTRRFVIRILPHRRQTMSCTGLPRTLEYKPSLSHEICAAICADCAK